LQAASERGLGTYGKAAAAISITACTMVAFSFPVTVLFALVGAVALFAGVLSPGWVLVLYTFSVVFEYVPLLSELKVAVPTAIGAFFLAGTFGHMALTRDMLRLRSRVPSLLTLTLIVFVAAAIEKPAWTFSNPRGLVTFAALWATGWASGQLLVHPKRPWYVVWALALGATLVSLMAIYESVTGHYNQFRLFSGYDERAFGLSDPNYAAATLVTLLPFLVALFVAFRSVLLKLVAASAVGLSIVAVAMTASRGGLLGVLVTIPATLLWVPVSRKRVSMTGNVNGVTVTSRGTPWARLGATAALLCALGLGVVLAPHKLWERAGATLEKSSVFDKEARVDIWATYLEKWGESLWWGHGPGYLDPATADQRLPIPHNTEIELLTEVGLIGACAFFLLNGMAWWEALKARKLLAEQGQIRLSILSGAVAASLVGFHTTALFLTRARTKELWLFFGLVAALHHMAKSGDHAAAVRLSNPEMT
jgi:O-antigen ligase